MEEGERVVLLCLCVRQLKLFSSTVKTLELFPVTPALLCVARHSTFCFFLGRDTMVSVRVGVRQPHVNVPTD